MPEDRDDGTPPLPSFAGRLRVADFMFKQDEEEHSMTASRRPQVGPQRVLRSGRSISTQEDSGSVVVSSSSWSSSSQHKRKASSGDDTTREQRQNTPPRAPSWTPSPRKRVLGSSSGPVSAAGSASKPRKTSSSQKKKPSKYAPPATYAHLPLLPDALAPHLLVLFVGLNPGLETARSGHAYAHPSNLFWKLLYKTGVTPVACRAEEDRTLPARFQLGLTNIVARPSRNGGELKAAELDAGVAALEAKARRWRPETVCLVGKSIWDSIVRVRHGRGGKKGRPAFRYGWQDESENMGRRLAARKLVGEVADNESDDDDDDDGDVADGVRVDHSWNGARVFVASSTSGLAASLSPAQKEAIWRELGTWVEQRRKEREAEATPVQETLDEDQDGTD